jgi:hypothetical protein
MAKLVEILDSAGIDSSRIDCWIDESCCFIRWYLDLKGPSTLQQFAERYSKADHIAIETACLKIETKMDMPFYNKKSVYGRIDKND